MENLLDKNTYKGYSVNELETLIEFIRHIKNTKKRAEDYLLKKKAHYESKLNKIDSIIKNKK